MFKLIPLLLLALSAALVKGQTTVSGRIKDNKGRPVSGASITLKDTYDGATSDSSGSYHFKTSERGEQTLVVTSIGFKPSEQKILLSGTPVKADISLKEAPNELSAVTITAGTFEANDTKRTTVLNPIDIVTTASANADVTAAIKTLPGAQQVGESEGLFVRGGTAQETKVFIDGTRVNNFFFSSVPDIAQRGRFSPFLFKGTVFSSGGYSALYGDALSAALILESVDLPDQSSASLGISTVGLSGGYQRLAKKKNASWGIDYNYTNLAASFAVIKQRPDYITIPEFHNSEFNFRIKTSPTGMLKFYGYFNYSRLGLRRPDIDSSSLKDAFTLTNVNYYTNLSWKESLGNGWKINLGTSYSNNEDRLGNQLQNQGNETQHFNYYPYNSKAFNLKAISELAQMRAVLEKKLYGLSALRFGGEYMYFRDKNNYTDGYYGKFASAADDHYTAAFAEADIYITNSLAAKVGGRLEHSTQLDKANIVPRLSLAQKVGKGQVSVAYGIFYQRPEKDYFIRNYKYPDPQYSRAIHYIANYQKVSHDYTFRVEAYYKKYKDLIKTYASAGSNILDSIGNSGFGEAKGVEFFWRDRKTFKFVDYWISYSYLDTKRNYLNYPFAMQPNFAAHHTASFVIKKFVTKWKTQFNGSYTFATGRPYYDLRQDRNDGKYKIFDQGTTISYNNLSLSVNYLPFIGAQSAKRFVVIVLSANNVLGSDQVFNYNYSYNGMRKEAVIPPSRRFFFLGVFMSFGVDRTEDVINSNL